MNNPDFSRRLLWHGLFLIILGLASGLAMLVPVEMFKNPRLALAGHLIGVTVGMFLLIAGLLWPRLRLSSAAEPVGFWSAVYGGYGNWAGTILGAVFGTGALTRLAAPGFLATAWQEWLITVLLSTSGSASLVCCCVFLWGLRGETHSQR